MEKLYQENLKILNLMPGASEKEINKRFKHLAIK